MDNFLLRGRSKSSLLSQDTHLSLIAFVVPAFLETGCPYPSPLRDRIYVQVDDIVRNTVTLLSTHFSYIRKIIFFQCSCIHSGCKLVFTGKSCSYCGKKDIKQGPRTG
jgi:hypothetical protein